jgi:hypothetical protein
VVAPTDPIIMVLAGIYWANLFTSIPRV